NNLAMFGAGGIRRRNKDVVLDALIFGHDDIGPTLFKKAAHQFVGATLDNFNNGGFRFAAVFASRLGQHAITMQDLEHFARGQEQVGAAIVAQKETKAVTMALNLAGYEIQLVVQQQLTLW